MVTRKMEPNVVSMSDIAKSHRIPDSSRKFIEIKPKIIGKRYLKAITKNNCFFLLKTLCILKKNTLSKGENINRYLKRYIVKFARPDFMLKYLKIFMPKLKNRNDIKMVQIEENRKNFTLSFFNIYINIIEGKFISKEIPSKRKLLFMLAKS